MVTLTELVEEEAARAEAEEPDEEEAEAEEPEPEPEAEEPEEPEEPEALAAIGEEEIRKAEKAREAQRKRLAVILGEGYVAHECIFCSGLGFTPEPPPVGTTLTVVEGEDGLAFEAQPPAPVVPLLSAPDKEMCPECDGYGEVLSGSKAPHAAITGCSKCSGAGWVIVPRAEPVGVHMSPPITSVPPPSLEGVPDAWGRPFGHQHWGVHPAQIPG